MELKSILERNGITIELTDEECDFLDSMHLPTKYPIGSALPDFYLDESICHSSILLAEKVLKSIIEKLGLDK